MRTIISASVLAISISAQNNNVGVKPEAPVTFEGDDFEYTVKHGLGAGAAMPGPNKDAT